MKRAVTIILETHIIKSYIFFSMCFSVTGKKKLKHKILVKLVSWIVYRGEKKRSLYLDVI